MTTRQRKFATKPTWLDKLERSKHGHENGIDARWAQMEAGIRPAPSRLWPPMIPYTGEQFSDVRVYGPTGQLIRVIPKDELAKMAHRPKDWLGNPETWAARKHRKGKYAMLSSEQHGAELRPDQG